MHTRVERILANLGIVQLRMYKFSPIMVRIVLTGVLSSSRTGGGAHCRFCAQHSDSLKHIAQCTVLKRAYQSAMRKHKLNGIIVDSASVLTFSCPSVFLPHTVCFLYCLTKALVGATGRQN